MWLLLCFLTVTFGATFEAVEARLTEIEPLRELRIRARAPRPSMADVRKATQGAVVVGLTGGRAWGVAVINVPIGKLWAGLNDETRHPGYTAVAYSELLTGRPCASGRSVLQYLPIPVPMVDDRWWIGHLRSNDRIARESGNSVRELVWISSVDPVAVTTVSGQKIIEKAVPITSSRGSWFLVAIDQFSTYIEYFSSSNPGEGIPTSVASRLATQGVRETIDAMQKFAKQGNPVCPVY